MTAPGKVPAELYANLVQLLQVEPAYYRNWGACWWRLKRMFKAAGYTRDALPLLGETTDEIEEHRWDDLDDATFMQDVSLPEQAHNATFRRNQEWQTHPDDEEGEYRIFDPDAEV